MPKDNRLVGKTLDIEGIGKVRVTGMSEGRFGKEAEFESAEPGVISRSMSLSQLESKANSGEVSEATPDPRKLHSNRSSRSQQLDEEFNAPLTTDIDQWAGNMDHWDFPGVDTGPKFREENPDFDTDHFFKTMLDF